MKAYAQLVLGLAVLQGASLLLLAQSVPLTIAPGQKQMLSLPDNTSPLVMTPSGEIVRVRELTQVSVAVSQVTAAYSLDPLVAEAHITLDHVSIWGRAPGQAVVMLVHSDFTTSSIQVAVTQAPPILPERAWGGLNSSRDSKGYYEARVSSNPMQINDVFDVHTGRMHLHIANAILPSGNLPGVSSTLFPFSYLSILGDRWKLTLLDENVDTRQSPSAQPWFAERI